VGDNIKVNLKRLA